MEINHPDRLQKHVIQFFEQIFEELVSFTTLKARMNPQINLSLSWCAFIFGQGMEQTIINQISFFSFQKFSAKGLNLTFKQISQKVKRIIMANTDSRLMSKTKSIPVNTISLCNGNRSQLAQKFQLNSSLFRTSVGFIHGFTDP